MKKVDTVVPFKKPDNDASGKEIKKKSNNSYHYDKGQLISECLFDILNFPKKQRKICRGEISLKI